MLLCGFYLPLAGSLHRAFGVCGNELAADGHVVDAEYGCGAHSDTSLPSGAGSPQFDAYDDGAVEMVEGPTGTEAGNADPDTETVTAEATAAGNSDVEDSASTS